MKNLHYSLLLLLLFSSASMGQEAVEVDRVDFNSLRDDTTQVQIELTCQGNPSPEARDSRFVENIKVRVYLAWERDARERDARERPFDYYTSELEILIMEQLDKNNVYFYLPGLIVERDGLNTDPDFFYVEISIDGEEQKPQKSAMSSNIPNLDILNSFISRARAEGTENKDILMPIYLLYNSGVDLGSVGALPTFLRRDVRD